MTILPPPAQAPLVLVKATEAYRLWHKNLVNLKRVDRYTIGVRIDEEFLIFLEYLFRASFAGDKFEKLSLLSASIGKCDLLKFLLQIAWEQKSVEMKLYTDLAVRLEEIGRMLGGWKRQTEQKTSPKKWEK